MRVDWTCTIVWSRTDSSHPTGQSKNKVDDMLEGLLIMDKLTTEDDFWKNESVALLALASIQGVGYWTLYKLAKSAL